MNDTSTHSEPRRTASTYLLLALALVASSVILWRTPWHTSAQLHTLIEAVATVLALFAGALALVRFYSKKENTFLFISTGFLGSALLDAYHAVVTSTWFFSYFPSSLPTLIPWSWFASRLFLSVLLWVSWLAWKREARMGDPGRLSETRIYVAVSILTLATFLLFAFVPLPGAYATNLFFDRPGELVPGLFFLLALIGYWQKGDWRSHPFDFWLIVSLIVGLASQVLFISFSSRLFDAMFVAGHALKLVSYVAILAGLLMDMYRLFVEAEGRAALEKEVMRRQQAEATIQRANEELAAANSELAAFSYSVSHDLRAPLRHIHGFAALLQKEAGTLNEKPRRYLATIIDSAERMGRLIDDLLAFSRTSRTEIQRTTVDLNQLLRDVISARGPETEARKIVWKLGALPHVQGDLALLRQVIDNLVGNALKYTGTREEACIEVAATATATGGDEIVVFVRDNGVGFDMRYADKLFGVFQRLHSSDEFEGTGIGLANVRRIIARHGGRTWAEGAVGKGATFYLSLPR